MKIVALMIAAVAWTAIMVITYQAGYTGWCIGEGIVGALIALEHTD